MRMDLGLTQTLKQIQTLSPQMYMSMEILCMNSLDLEERIETELEDNVALEVQDKAEAVETPADTELSQAEEAKFEEQLERWDQIIHDEDDIGPKRLSSSFDTDRDEKLDALNNTEDRPVSLAEHLEEQLLLLNEEDFARFGIDSEEVDQILGLCREILYNLDERGYLRYPLEEIHASLLKSIRQSMEEIRLEMGLDASVIPPSLSPAEPAKEYSSNQEDPVAEALNPKLEDAQLDKASQNGSAPDLNERASREREAPDSPPKSRGGFTLGAGTHYVTDSRVSSLDNLPKLSSSHIEQEQAKPSLEETYADGLSLEPTEPARATEVVEESPTLPQVEQNPAETDQSALAIEESEAQAAADDSEPHYSPEDLQYMSEDVQQLLQGFSDDQLPTLDRMQLALSIVQTLDPPGIGGKDLKECLILQLERDHQSYPIETRIIEDFLDDLAHNRMPKIARALGVSIEEVKEAQETIASLNPLPGKLYGGDAPQYIKPDVLVDEVDGKLEVQVTSDYLPPLRVSDYYLKLYKQMKEDPETRKFIKKKLENAEWLLTAIRQRQSTLERIAREIVDIQGGFFKHGIAHLKPLKMVDVAERVGVHVSTISRAISGKYMQSPQGLQALKFFFTGGAQKEDGSMEARGSVIQKIKNLIDGEDKKKPLSDIEIQRRLESESGIKISRRTVTKYREAENIPSSRQRREY